MHYPVLIRDRGGQRDIIFRPLSAQGYMQDRPIAAIVLAAGKGTRMKSALPKVLHSVCGITMVEHVLRALKGVQVEKTIVVIGHGADSVASTLGSDYTYGIQDPPQGTGDAVRVGLEALGEWNGPIIVCYGDTPLLTSTVFEALVARQEQSSAAVVAATILLQNPSGYGRIIRDGEEVLEVVEEKNASTEQKLIKEVNAGVYCFDGQRLAAIVPQFSKDNPQGEYLLTDAVSIARSMGGLVVGELFSDAAEFEGVNDRWSLSQAEKVMRQRINREHALAGVTLIDPDSTYIGLDVTIGTDAIIHPQTHLSGKSVIGPRSEIGPSTKITNSIIGEGCLVHFSRIDDSEVSDGAKVGPFANLRGKAKIGRDAKIGNFVEIKNSDLAEKVSVAHLSYVGDAAVGARTNIGAGTITCNYDGFQKHRTKIGSDVFVGSQSTLVAPVTIGDGAMVAAGSVITKTVGPSDGAFGRARQENKENWAYEWRKKKAQS
jgi:bifunctional UDP-N-acetylglucosamine pyrophosphorylase / glucosamine-1-phosphate N-acetyltransferase